jgi:hypothetical protein
LSSLVYIKVEMHGKVRNQVSSNVVPLIETAIVLHQGHQELRRHLLHQRIAGRQSIWQPQDKSDAAVVGGLQASRHYA